MRSPADTTPGNIAPDRPRRPYDEYQEAKADLVAIALVAALEISRDPLRQDSFLGKSLLECANNVRTLRNWILREPAPWDTKKAGPSAGPSRQIVADA